MTKIESEARTVFATQESVYNVLSEPAYLEQIRQTLQSETAKGVTFDAEGFTIETSTGTIKLKMTERTPHEYVKFATTVSPLPFALLIQLLPANDDKTCRIRVTIELDVNPFMLGMMRKPLQDELNKMSQLLAAIPYDSLLAQ
jgi:hypothetical protein